MSVDIGEFVAYAQPSINAITERGRHSPMSSTNGNTYRRSPSKEPSGPEVNEYDAATRVPERENVSFTDFYPNPGGNSVNTHDFLISRATRGTVDNSPTIASPAGDQSGRTDTGTSFHDAIRAKVSGATVYDDQRKAAGGNNPIGNPLAEAPRQYPDGGLG